MNPFLKRLLILLQFTMLTAKQMTHLAVCHELIILQAVDAMNSHGESEVNNSDMETILLGGYHVVFVVFRQHK